MFFFSFVWLSILARVLYPQRTAYAPDSTVSMIYHIQLMKPDTGTKSRFRRASAILHVSGFHFMMDFLMRLFSPSLLVARAKSVLIPHYITNIMLSVMFFTVKTISPVCDSLFENCFLELVSYRSGWGVNVKQLDQVASAAFNLNLEIYSLISDVTTVSTSYD